MSTDDEQYHNVLNAFKQIRDEMLEAFRVHKEIVNRALVIVHNEVVDLGDLLDKYNAKLDTLIDQLTKADARTKRWEWIRLGIQVGAFLVIIIMLVVAVLLIIQRLP